MQHALHHIHAHAAAGDFGDLFGGAEAGAEDEVEGFGFVQARSFFRRGDAQLDGLGPNLLGIDAAAVVGDFDHDLVAVVIRVQPDHPLRRLAQLCGALRQAQCRG